MVIKETEEKKVNPDLQVCLVHHLEQKKAAQHRRFSKDPKAKWDDEDPKVSQAVEETQEEKDHKD